MPPRLAGDLRLQDEVTLCRADRQRLVSENAVVLLRAATAQEGIVRLRTQPAPKMTGNTPEAS
jgi:hypothetical protein